MTTLTINQLSLTYRNGVKALDNISLQISKGMFGLLGPNGAGKSSLMKTITGLHKPSSGAITLDQIDIIRHPGYIRKHLGFLPQDFGVYPKLSAYELLQHLAVLKGVANKIERKKQVLSLLEKVNLVQVKDKEVHSFSGGMKQRFGVAQALLGNPGIIIVDEPTAGLDPEERNRFNMLLSEISEEIIVLLSTHLVEDVQNLCSQFAIIHKGAILAKGKPAALIASLHGKIWSKQIESSSLQHYREMYRVLHQQLKEKKLFITVYSEEPLPDFTPIPPTLEQVYFYSLSVTPEPGGI